MTLGPLCNGCVLKANGGTGYAISRGSLTHGVMLVGEALGEDEAEQSLPFVGKSGEFLDRVISRTKDPRGEYLRSSDFLITNTIRCRPPNNELVGTWYEHKAVATCAPYLRDFIRANKPKCIVAIGGTALKWFIGEKGNEYRKFGIEKLRGYIWDTEYGPVIGTLHPSYIMRGKFNLTRLVQSDLLKALYVSRFGIPSKPTAYVLHPSTMDLEKFTSEYFAALAKDSETLLSFDIETPHSSTFKDDEIDPEMEDLSIEDDPSYTIQRISFSFAPGKGVTFPWIHPFISYAKKLLASPGTKVYWNGRNFDIPRLVANDCAVNGPGIDGMDLLHWLEPGFPMGLGFAATILTPDVRAWKHLSGVNPEYYSAVDSDVALRCVLTMRRQAIEEGRWETFRKHFIELGDILKRMSNRGVRVSRELRKKALDDFCTRFDGAVARSQPLVPVSVKPRKIYKTEKERLVKQGKWIEDRMIEVTSMEKVKHQHSWMCISPGNENVWCTCLKQKKRPKKFTCTCLQCPAIVKKKRGKKNANVS